MMLNKYTLPSIHSWHESDKMKEKNIGLTELCKIVCEYEKEISVNSNTKEEKANTKKDEKVESKLLHLEYILNKSDDSNNKENEQKLPPLKTICQSLSDTTKWQVPSFPISLTYPVINIPSNEPHFIGYSDQVQGVQPLTPIFYVMPELNSQRVNTTQENISEQNLYMKDKIIDQRKSKQFIKKLRRTVTTAEREVLEKYYSDNPYPTRQRYDEIRRRLGWNSSRRVTKWFNNRRYNEKNK